MNRYNYPIAVDLDGTLINTDLLYESLIKIISKKPWLLFLMPFWIICGKAHFKNKVSSQVDLDVTSLPYNHDLIDLLKQLKNEGAKLILATASDEKFARLVADYLNIFDEVLASNGKVNLSGKIKAEVLSSRFGIKEFFYVGNSNADIHVWTKSRGAIVISSNQKFINKVKLVSVVELVLPGTIFTLRSFFKVIRIHQWMKNLLLFIPLFAAHDFNNYRSWENLILAFFSFGFCASSVYITNDLFDLENDRKHPRKFTRPFASGCFSIPYGLFISLFMLMISFFIASTVNSFFLICLVVYFVLTLIYSFSFKRLVIVDCVTLAVLYTLRVVAGAEAVDLPPSFWLIGFSVFLFLSLALVKRYSEIKTFDTMLIKNIHGRGYVSSDLNLVQSLGVCSGYLSTLILAMYLQSENVIRLYENPNIIWLALPILLVWISWVWLKAHRDEMHDDPILFAVTDKKSIFLGFLITAVFIIASINWSHAFGY